MEEKNRNGLFCDKDLDCSKIAWGMGHGARGMGHCAWSMEQRVKGMGHGVWGMEHRVKGMGHRAWGLGCCAWGMEHGAWGIVLASLRLNSPITDTRS